ncbi:MAG: ABC transporter permease [Phycisphaerales bacterium]|nr:ABC transporter permease [Phycisphaerales bacterium]
MNRTLTIAWREFKATVLTKGFLIGVLVVPLMMAASIPLVLLLTSMKPPAVAGEVAIIDLSTSPGGEHEASREAVLARLTPEALAERVRRETGEGLREAGKMANKVDPRAGEALAAAAPTIEAAAVADLPSLTTRVLAPDADLDAEKAVLLEGTPYDNTRLALIVIDPDAITRTPDAKEFGSFRLFVKAKLDSRVQGMIRSQVRDGIVDARLAASGHVATDIRDLMRIKVPEAQSVTKDGDKAWGELQQMLVPVAFMILLWISTFTGGQYLLTSTIEEKSSRVMEVLLSAVSPMQLMTGKILGQMGAGLLILLLYSGTGVAGLLTFGLGYLVSPLNLVFLLIFFFIAFFSIAALMAAVGSAVTDVHEAQTLLTPVMLVVITPMFLMMPIIWNPNSVLATTMSFLPPINPFVMVLRICSSDPPPLWQILASAGVGIVGVFILLKATSKIFRVGVLMYGKPPNLVTLLRWIKMA